MKKKKTTDIQSHCHASQERKTILLTSLPPRRIELIGRDAELAELEQTLKISKHIVLVNGLGGIGKTELCKTFFYIHYQEYNFAAYVEWYGSVKDSLVYALGGDTSKFIQVSESDIPDERFEKIKMRLGEMTESMLLVMDHIENPETDGNLEMLLSLPACIKILANSRYHIEGVEERYLDFFSEEECEALFYRYYKGKRDDKNDFYVKKVIELCGYHTLTVELLARTAHYEGINLAKLHETLKSKGFNLNAMTFGKINTFWRNEKEKKTFFDHLAKVFDLVNLTERERSVLGNLSILPAVYISQEWVREWLKLETNDDIVSLVDKGWIKRDSDYRIYMHPVTGDVVRAKLNPGAEMCRYLIDSLTWKLKCEPDDNPIHKKGFLIYGESVVQWIGAENDQDLAMLANNISAILYDIGQLIRALEFQMKALTIRENILAPNHPDLAASYNNVSLIYKYLGQLDRALEFQLKTVKIFETVLDPNHPDLATSYNNVSQIYLAQGQTNRALEFQLKDIAISERVLGEDHPSLATSYNNVSMIYQDMGQLGRALEFQLKTIKIFEAVLDLNHPHLAASYHNLSIIYRDMNDYSAAIEFSERAVAILEFNFPDGHPNLDVMKRNLETIRKSVRVSAGA